MMLVRAVAIAIAAGAAAVLQAPCARAMATGPGKAPRCNPEAAQARMLAGDLQLQLQGQVGRGSAAALVTLSQPAGEEASWPAALDGSPYAFYGRLSTTNSTKWTVFFQGRGLGWTIEIVCR